MTAQAPEYHCESCGKLTDDTNYTADDVRLCDDCWKALPTAQADARRSCRCSHAASAHVELHNGGCDLCDDCEVYMPAPDPEPAQADATKPMWILVSGERVYVVPFAALEQAERDKGVLADRITAEVMRRNEAIDRAEQAEARLKEAVGLLRIVADWGGSVEGGEPYDQIVAFLARLYREGGA